MKLFPSERTVKRFALGCALLVGVLLVVNAFMSWRVQRQADALIAEIRAAGDPATLADLKPPPIPDEENAAYWLKKVSRELDNFGKDQSQFFDTPLGKSYDVLPEGAQPTADQLAEIRKILNRSAEKNPAVRRIAACEKNASLADFLLPPREFLEPRLQDDLRWVRNLTRRQAWEIEALTGEGRIDEAVETGRELLKLARLHEQEPLLVSYMVSMAIYGIAARSIGDAVSAGKISDEVYIDLDQELAKSVPLPGFVSTLKSERAYALSHESQQVFAWLDSEVQPSPFQRVLGKLFDWSLKRHFVASVEYMNRVIPAIARQEGQRTAVLDNSQLFPKSDQKEVFVALLQPVLESAIESHCRMAALTRTVRVFSALERFEQTSGRAATGLVDLDVPKEATTDPFTGEPLKVKHTEHGWVVYSVGKNGVDDGGLLADYSDIGYAPPAVRFEQSKKQ